MSLDKLGINDQSAFDKVLETINGFGKASQAEIARVMKAASGLGVKGQEALSDLYKSIAKLSPCRLASLDGGGFRRVLYAVVSSLFISTAYADAGCGPGGVSGFVADTLDAVKTVRGKISNVGQAIPGTTVPRHFNLKTAGESFHVHPNATKHMGEYIKSLPVSHGAPLRNDLILASFEGAVNDAVTSGAWKVSLDTGKLIVSGGWELIFSKKAGDALPVIKHALMKK